MADTISFYYKSNCALYGQYKRGRVRDIERQKKRARDIYFIVIFLFKFDFFSVELIIIVCVCVCVRVCYPL